MTDRTSQSGSCWMWCRVMLLILGLAALSVRAQNTDDTEAVAKIGFTRDQFNELTQKMLEVADLLETTEPETAQALRMAASQAEKAFIADDMARVGELLGEGLLSAAGSGQEEVISELELLLETLRHGQVDPDERKQRIAEWEERLRQIGELEKKQQELESQTRSQANAEEISAEMAALDERLKSLIAEQEKLLGETQSQRDSAAVADAESVARLLEDVQEAQSYQDLAEEAIKSIGVDRLPMLAEVEQGAADDIRALAEQATALGEQAGLVEKISAAGGDPQVAQNAAQKLRDAAAALDAAGEALAKPDSEAALNEQANAKADLQDAANALESMLDGLLKDTPVGALEAQQKALSETAEDLAQTLKNIEDASGVPVSPANAEKAASEMAEASENLSQGQMGRAEKNQEEALRRLKDEHRELAQLKQRVEEMQKRPVERQEKDQSDLADQAGKAAEGMKKGEDGSEATPGQQSVEKAGESMEGAAGSLGQGEQDDANTDQNDALEELRKAKRQLAQAIEDEKAWLEQEKLAKVVQLLQRALDQQQKLTKSTRMVDAENPDSDFSRASQLKLSELAQSERDINTDIATITAKLDEEGKSKVFPAMLDKVSGDLTVVSQRLDSLLPDVPTQDLQVGVEELLEEMIGAIRDEIKRREVEGAGGGGGAGEDGGGEESLLPASAELKMLRRMQLQINAQTTRVESQRDTMGEEDATARFKDLAERQAKAAELTRGLVAPAEGAPAPTPEGDQPHPDGTEEGGPR